MNDPKGKRSLLSRSEWTALWTLLACVTALPASADVALSPQLQYFPDTGELQIANPDPAVAQVVITGGPFIVGNFNQPPSSSTLLFNSSNLSILFLHPQPAGPVSFGPILPAGLDQAGFESRINTATSQGNAMALVYVPEPASLMVLSLGGLAACRRRRRRRVA